MPLKLKPPRPGKTPYWSVRGTHRGVYVDRSTGAVREAEARKKLKQWELEIERGDVVETRGPTFMSAATAYIKAGGEARFLGSFDEDTGLWSGLLAKLGDKPLAGLAQTDIDNAAVELYPTASPATRNRQVYTVVSAVLKHAGVEKMIRRPRGGNGKTQTSWLMPEQLFALLASGTKRDAEFGILLTLLAYTGMRLSEALDATLADLDLGEAFLRLPDTKNGEPRGVYLPQVVVVALANHPKGLDRKGRIFRFTKCGALYDLLREAAKKAGVALPTRSAFHLLRHTWGTWMRRYGGLDDIGLVATGAWRDRKSASRYAHAVVSEEARRADLLPTASTWTRGKSVETRKKMRKNNER